MCCAAGLQVPWGDTTVVELGAGLGLPGIFLAKKGAKAHHLLMLPVQNFAHLANHTQMDHPTGHAQDLHACAQVTFTDKQAVLPLLLENVQQNLQPGGMRSVTGSIGQHIGRNKRGSSQSQPAPPQLMLYPCSCRDQGSGRVVELDWSHPKSMQVIETLRSPIPEFVIAADCLYINEVGGFPLPHSTCRAMHWQCRC